MYLQDEWKLTPKLTLNYGARFDVFSSSFDNENQISPRVNLIYQADGFDDAARGLRAIFHAAAAGKCAGEQRGEVQRHVESSAVTQDDPVKAERANYFDAGITQKLTWIAGRRGRLLQDGPQPTRRRLVRAVAHSLGVQLCQGRGLWRGIHRLLYQGRILRLCQCRRSEAQGKNWNSAQFLFDPNDLAYVQNHWIYLDHDQRVTGSFGAAYTWKETSAARGCTWTRFTAAACGQTATTCQWRNHPQRRQRAGLLLRQHGCGTKFKLGPQTVKVRLDIVNVTDNIYELRNGSGVGVNAAQYGERLGFFGSLSYVF